MNEYQENEDFVSSDNDSVNTPISDKGDGELVMNELSVYHYDVKHEFSEEYFVGYQITSLMGYKNLNQAINNVSKSNQLEFRDYPGVKIPYLDPRTILNIAQTVAGEFGVDVKILESASARRDNYIPQDVPISVQTDFNSGITEWAKWLKLGVGNALSD
jgi:hypothetical protein